MAHNSNHLFEQCEIIQNEKMNEDDFSCSPPEERQKVLFERSQAGELDLDSIMVCATQGNIRKAADPIHLSKVWKISPEDAKRTLEVTTQRRKNAVKEGLTRNYSTSDRMLRYKRINEIFFMDTFQAAKHGGKSSRGNQFCQLFVTDKGFLYVVPIKKRSEVLQAVKQFAKEIGAPSAIICDHSAEQTSKEMKKFCGELGTSLKVLEEGTPWANRAELYIGIIKEAVRQDLKESGSPLPFWDYCVERRVRIHNLTARDTFQLKGQHPHSVTMMEEGDISNSAIFGWYEWCYFREHTAAFPFPQEVLGRVLGPARGEGNEMAQWVLKANGNVVPRRTVRPLREQEKRHPVVRRKQGDFDAFIEKRFGTSWKAKERKDDDEDIIMDEEVDELFASPPTEAEDGQGRPINQQPMWDKMLHQEIVMNKGAQTPRETFRGVVKRRAISPEGKTTGTYDDDPKLNTMEYEVEFDDGMVREYAANVIAENMLSQEESEQFTVRMFEAIIDHQKVQSAKTSNKSKEEHLNDWKLLVRWKNGSEEWRDLKELKDSLPVDVAEYTKAKKLDQEDAFKCWVPFTLCKRDAIVAAISEMRRHTTHKFGIEIPKSVQQAIAVDKKNGDTYWQDAIKKEMVNIGIAFEILEESQPTPVGWSKVTGHMIFDVKMDFTRKARWVLDGHKTPSVEGSTYAGVVSRESVRIALTYAALNGLQVFAGDIQNAYLQAPSSQKDYIVCGQEFGLENVGKRALIHRALYGGKAAGRDFRNHLRNCIVTCI